MFLRVDDSVSDLWYFGFSTYCSFFSLHGHPRLVLTSPSPHPFLPLSFSTISAVPAAASAFKVLTGGRAREKDKEIPEWLYISLALPRVLSAADITALLGPVSSPSLFEPSKRNLICLMALCVDSRSHTPRWSSALRSADVSLPFMRGLTSSTTHSN